MILPGVNILLSDVWAGDESEQCRSDGRQLIIILATHNLVPGSECASVFSWVTLSLLDL